MTPPLERLTAALSDRYRLERELGAGGMATVYLAHDLKHDRQVAIKVLRPELAAVIGAERFLSEIRTTANLQHPHILPLFDSGRTGGQADGRTEDFLFYVMPFIEGESLRDRLNREKQLPISEVVRIATEVASALDYAHRHGVIHRDIKPENVLLHDGSALVADFGIALAASSAGSTRMTETGISLGTPQYMSPEQAMGERELDARSDVYALGCLSYEMLTGEPPFGGPTAQAIVAKVMTAEPAEVRSLRRTIPQHVADAVHTALQKLPADRFRTAAEMAAALADPAWQATLPIRGTGRRWRQRVPWVIAVLGIGIAAWSGWRLGHRPAPAPLRFTMVSSTTGDVVPSGELAISADGRVLVYQGTSHGVARLYRRSMADPEAVPLAGTEGAEEPVISPDGHWVAFASPDGFVKKTLLAGGPVTTLVKTPTPAGLGWDQRSGLLLGMPAFSDSIRGLSLVAETGDSMLHVFTHLKPDWGMHHGPFAMIDPTTVLYTDYEWGSNRTRIGVASLTDGSWAPLDLPGEVILGLADDILLYLTEDRTLMAVRFDRRKRRLVGEPIRVTGAPRGLQQGVLAPDGTLALRIRTTDYQIVLVDQQGSVEPLLPDTIGFFVPRFSPDGRRLAIAADLHGSDLGWVYDFGSRTLSKLGFGFDPSSFEWMRDGRLLVTLFARPQMATQPADASGPVAVLLDLHTQVISATLSPDQRTLVVGTGYGVGGFNIMVRHLDGDTTLTPFVASEANEGEPRFSPDGRWIAYTSDESGRYEVYIRPFPGPGPRIQLSDTGGSQPVWAPDAHRVYYRTGRAMMAAELGVARPGSPPTVAKRNLLFTGNFFTGQMAPAANPIGYDVAPDGRHFVMARAAGQGEDQIVVWTNWLPELKRQLQGN